MFELDDFGDSEAIERFREIGVGRPEIVTSERKLTQTRRTTMRFMSMVKFERKHS